MTFLDFKQLIRDGSLADVRLAIDAQPDLIHTIDVAPEAWDQRTALHCAARFAKLDVARLFVERGAEVYSNPMSSYPAVYVADCYRHFDGRPNAQHVVDYFLNEIPHLADGTNGLGVTINLAAREGWTVIVKRHIEIDPLSVHQRGWIGDTPLHWPCHNGHVNVVELLLDGGADIEADEINCYGGKPLHWASEHAPAVVQLLLTRGANVNSRNVLKKSKYCGATPLLYNAMMKDDCSDVTRLLLDSGATPSITHNGKTAEQIAEEMEHARILRVLQQQAS